VIPDEEIERVRESADIVAIVSEFVTLKRMGSGFRGPCPFHQGTHRNFSVDQRRKRYHCFVCGEGGDVFTFLQKRLGIDWPTSVRMVAEKSGIELREVQTRREGPDPREPLWEVNAAAQEYFQRVLWQETSGAAAREYLTARDVTRSVADRFGLGFAPRDLGAMRGHLAVLGFDDARLLEAGLVMRREESGDLRPRFRSRLIFPIFDVTNKVVGFGGRLIAPGEPKYLNSADSPAFAKGKLLYGLNWARHSIRRADRVLLVEGYFDLVRLVSAGIEEVVAPLGTALTPDQAELIVRHSKQVFLLYDGDRAGLKATFRAGDELLRVGASVRVVTLPDGDDPDSFVRRHGKDAMERQLGQAIDVFERKIQLLQRGGWFAGTGRGGVRRRTGRSEWRSRAPGGAGGRRRACR
jgi:DNA primase